MSSRSDVEAVAFRAVIYMEMDRLRYTSPTMYAEHIEEMGGPTGSLALAFIDTLNELDWLAVRVMAEHDRDPGALVAGLAVLSVRSPERFEAVLHALVIGPPEEEWCEPIDERWQEVEQAMDGLRFWNRRVEDLPGPDDDERTAIGEALDGWPPPGQDPSVSARTFETALALTINEFRPSGRMAAL
jgi:hypothetical protein